MGPRRSKNAETMVEDVVCENKKGVKRKQTEKTQNCCPFSTKRSLRSKSLKNGKQINKGLDLLVQKEETKRETKLKNISPDNLTNAKVSHASNVAKSFLPDLNFSVERLLPDRNVVRPFVERSNNIVYYLYDRHSSHSGHCAPAWLCCKNLQQPIINSLSSLKLYRTASPFQARIMEMEWHPKYPNIVAVVSKWGDIILLNVDQINKDVHLQGCGRGDQINSMHFLPNDYSKLLTASVDGTTRIRDIEGKQDQVLLDTGNCMLYWYCSSDISKHQNVILAGDSVGNVQLVTPKGEMGWKHRLHKSKVTHMEFNHRDQHIFCSASVDRTVKLWDIRMVKDRKSALYELVHERPINSAYFSLTDGCRLLTTDQYDELRVYSGPSWNLERTIKHPHRHFQHITNIKASWHPLQDLIVVGRYPDDKFCGHTPSDARTVDIYDCDSGEIVHQLLDTSAPGIISLNKFNPQGDHLVSGMGFNILIWSNGQFIQEKHDKLRSDLIGLGIDPTRNDHQSSHRRQSREKKKDTDLKTKVKIKTKVKEAKK